MKNKKLIFLCFVWLSVAVVPAIASPPGEDAGARTVTFRFTAGDDMFYTPWEGNGDQLGRLYSLVDEYRAEISGGRMPVYVDGYCASLASAKENLNTAYIRANRVKSELITHKGLIEGNFVTKNYATAYTAPNGHTYRDMVVITLRIPAAEQPKPVVEKTKEESEPAPVKESHPDPVVVEQTPDPQPLPQATAPATSASWREPYRFAVRTNLLYDAFLLPTLGLEWRVNEHLGVKLDGSRSWWGGGDNGRVQKIWLVSPEVRWYLLNAKRFYIGLAGNYGEYNIYKYPVGGLFSSDTGYQGKLWSAGATVGYQLPLCRALSLDFNLGIGYTRSEYDNFTVNDGVRIYKEKDKAKNLFGPMQAGVSLIWRIGANGQER